MFRLLGIAEYIFSHKINESPHCIERVKKGKMGVYLPL